MALKISRTRPLQRTIVKPQNQHYEEEESAAKSLDKFSGTALEMVNCEDTSEYLVTEGSEKNEPCAVTAGKAFLVFLGYVVGQILGSLAVAFAAGVLASMRGVDLNNPWEKAELASAMITPTLIGGVAGGTLAMFVLAFLLFRKQLRNPSRHGAAWRLGTFRQWVAGFFLGGIISLSMIFIMPTVFPPDDFQQTGPLAQMAMTPGLPRLTWFLFALLLAPVVEEMLFRGIVFAGFCRRWGVVGGAIFSTLLFVLLHIPEVKYYWPAVLGITAIALTALAMRLRTAAVGPAIAAHFAYNLMVAGIVFLSIAQTVP